MSAMMTMRSLAVILTSALMGFVSCTTREHSFGAGSEVDTIGDTVVVASRQGGVWGRPRSLVRDLTIGPAGDLEVVFGAIADDIALLPGGGVVVTDIMTPQRVLVFGPDGRLVRQVGRAGEGPGEYRDVIGLAANPVGSIAVVDQGNARAMVYDSLGKLISEWRTNAWFYVGHAVGPGRGSAFVLRLLHSTDATYQGLGLGHRYYLEVSPAGVTLDSISTPYHDERDFHQGFGPLQPHRYSEWHPDGFVVTGRSDEYAIEVFSKEGWVVRMVRPWTPVGLTNEEWEIWNEARDYMVRRGGRYTIPEIPRVKPAYSRIIIARTGEIWIQRHTEAVELGRRPRDIMAAGGSRASPWQEPLLLDVFRSDGRYLGAVEGPPGVTVGAISGDTLWAIEGFDDIPRVVRYVLSSEGRAPW